MKPIVAFLQNMYVRPAQVRTVEASAPTSDIRERMIHYALFARCTTGRRLRALLGQDLCDLIIWQEASPVIASDATTYHAPDSGHIRAVCAKHRPGLVISFTRAGEDVIKANIPEGTVFVPCCHPAARNHEAVDRLLAVRRLIDLLIAGDAVLAPAPTARRIPAQGKAAEAAALGNAPKHPASPERATQICKSCSNWEPDYYDCAGERRPIAPVGFCTIHHSITQSRSTCRLFSLAILPQADMGSAQSATSFSPFTVP